jgi:hypothetical protein
VRDGSSLAKAVSINDPVYEGEVPTPNRVDTRKQCRTFSIVIIQTPGVSVKHLFATRVSEQFQRQRL